MFRKMATKTATWPRLLRVCIGDNILACNREIANSLTPAERIIDTAPIVAPARNNANVRANARSMNLIGLDHR